MSGSRFAQGLFVVLVGGLLAGSLISGVFPNNARLTWGTLLAGGETAFKWILNTFPVGMIIMVGTLLVAASVIFALVSGMYRKTRNYLIRRNLPDKKP